MATDIKREQRNPLFVSDLPLPDNIRAEAKLERTTANHDLLVMAVPTPFTRNDKLKYPLRCSALSG